MVYLNELLKFIKLFKNVQTFNEGYLVELFHAPKDMGEYTEYMVKCLQMVRDVAFNKDFLTMSKIKLNVVFENEGIVKVIYAVVLSKSKEKIA